MKLRQLCKSFDKRRSQPAISISARNINMKMRWIILTDVINVLKICDIIEMIQLCGIFEAACEISNCTPGVIECNKKTVSMSNNISSERHLSKGLFFFLVAKIPFRARFEKNVVYIAEVAGEISNFVCFLYFHDHEPQPPP